MTNYTANTHSATGPGTNKLDAGVATVARGFTLRVVTSASDSIVVLETSPDNTAWTAQDTVTGDGWGYASSHHTRRYARANVTSLGTGAPGMATNISSYV